MPDAELAHAQPSAYRIRRADHFMLASSSVGRKIDVDRLPAPPVGGRCVTASIGVPIPRSRGCVSNPGPLRVSDHGSAGLKSARVARHEAADVRGRRSTRRSAADAVEPAAPSASFVVEPLVKHEHVPCGGRRRSGRDWSPGISARRPGLIEHVGQHGDARRSARTCNRATTPRRRRRRGARAPSAERPARRPSASGSAGSAVGVGGARRRIGVGVGVAAGVTPSASGQRAPRNGAAIEGAERRVRMGLPRRDRASRCAVIDRAERRGPLGAAPHHDSVSERHAPLRPGRRARSLGVERRLGLLADLVLGDAGRQLDQHAARRR